jgi:hypothetical protein
MAKFILVNEQQLASVNAAIAALQAALGQMTKDAGQVVLPDAYPQKPPSVTAAPSFFESHAKPPNGAKYKVTRGMGWKHVISSEFPDIGQYSLDEIVHRVVPLVAHQSSKRNPRDTIRRALDSDPRFARVDGTTSLYRRVR